MESEKSISKSYEAARDRYAGLSVDTDAAIQKLMGVSLSLHCWQGDDVGGFEKQGTGLSGGLQVTGRYPGKARTIEELRMDLKKAYSLIPGHHRLNLHAMYGEFGGAKVDRDEIDPEHFRGWIDWAKREDLKLDFNATCFSHPKADAGFTLSSKDGGIRDFWKEHVKRCRRIAAFMGRELGSSCIHNLWIPDGSKDAPVDRRSHREILKKSLDDIFREEYECEEMKDALESKLFGIGSESYVVGSHEFYMGYAISRKKMICLDMGHFHPTESVADKISAVLPFFEELLIHVSRGVRWDSDHVVILNDEVRSLAEEIVRSDALDRVHIAFDFFDASLDRVGAWIIGARAMQKALLMALLEPLERLRTFEENGRFFERLALMEALKMTPFGVVWDAFCLRLDVPDDVSMAREIEAYELDVLNKRI